jgi:hypothetical protein
MNVVLMAVTLAAALATGDTSVTGTWNLQSEVAGNTGSAVCTLAQDGNKITGKCTMGDNTEQKVTGEVDGDKVTFSHGAEYNGEALTVTYSGKLESATVLSGNVNVQPYNVDGTFKATKKTE